MIKVKTPDGLVHGVSPLAGSEYTLCGFAFDAADSEADESLRWSQVRRGAISCHGCATLVMECRGVRVQKPDNDRVKRGDPVSRGDSA